MVELGQVGRPPLENFEGKRKLYCVPNIYNMNNAPDEYTALFAKYWDEAAAQAERLEAAGKIRKIFHEGIHIHGEEALDAIARLNEKSSEFIRRKVQEGAVIYPLEREDIFGPFLDWGNCLNIVRTKEVFTRIFESYSDLLNKRLLHAAGVITDNLSGGEAALLIMRDEDRVKLQLPPDIEIFLVTPPAYDDILRWVRAKMKEA